MKASEKDALLYLYGLPRDPRDPSFTRIPLNPDSKAHTLVQIVCDFCQAMYFAPSDAGTGWEQDHRKNCQPPKKSQ